MTFEPPNSLRRGVRLGNDNHPYFSVNVDGDITHQKNLPFRTTPFLTFFRANDTDCLLIRVSHCKQDLCYQSHALLQQTLRELVFDGCSLLQSSVPIVSHCNTRHFRQKEAHYPAAHGVRTYLYRITCNNSTRVDNTVDDHASVGDTPYFGDRVLRMKE